MIRPLPHWVVTDLHPAFYDTESATAIEMVAKLYAKMQELIKKYNSFVDKINQAIKDYENDMNQSFEDFKSCVMKLMSDYIETLDMKIATQDAKIQNAIEYMKDNITQTASDLFTQALENGDIQAGLNVSYDSTTESLVISFSAEGGENNG